MLLKDFGTLPTASPVLNSTHEVQYSIYTNDSNYKQDDLETKRVLYGMSFSSSQHIREVEWGCNDNNISCEQQCFTAVHC